MRYANEVLNRMGAEEIRAYQEERLLRQIRYCHDNSAFYRERFADVGVQVEDIRSLEDFYAMPILMDKSRRGSARRGPWSRTATPSARTCATTRGTWP